MLRKLAYITLFFSVLFSEMANAQLEGKALTDSLLGELPRAKGDTNNVKLLAAVAVSYFQSDFEKAIAYCEQAISLAEKLNMSSGVSTANYLLGNMYAEHSDFGNALKCYNVTLVIEQKGGDKVAIASVLNNIAACYSSLSDYPKTLEANLRALKLFEETKEKNGTANCLINIGGVYAVTDENAKALDYYKRALKVYRELGSKRGIALALNNMGDIYGRQRDYPSAQKSFKDALRLYEEVGSADGCSMALNNMAAIFNSLGDYLQAIECGLKSLKIAQENELPESIAYDYKTIAETYFGIATNDSTKKTTPVLGHTEALVLAKQYIDSSISAFTAVGSLNEVAAAAETASNIASASGDYKGAYANHMLFKKMNDSVFNMEKDKKLTQAAMQYEFDKKEAAARAGQQRKDIIQRNIRNSILAGLAGALVFGVVVMRQRNRVRKEKARSEELLLNILPSEVAEELKEKGSADAKLMDEVTVLFTDFKGFTQLSEKLSPKELVAEINTCFSAFDRIMQKNGVEKIKTIGDAYMAAGGLPTPNNTHAEDVVKAALEIQDFMRRHKAEREAAGKLFFEIRIGIHSGSVVAGIVGVKKFAYDIWGDTVNTAARMEQSGVSGKINISETTYELVKDKFHCEYRGELEAKGKGMMKMYFVS